MLFSLEHVTGLGDLYLILFPLTALSLYVMWHERERFRDETFRASEFVFLFALLYGAVWRLSSPEIVEDNDRLSDFHLVANYLSGEKLCRPSTTGCPISGSITIIPSSTIPQHCSGG